MLIAKLLKPDGWLLLDDLDWAFGEDYASPMPFSPEERTVPHMREVFEVIVKQEPAFTELRDDGQWGWAHKQPGQRRRMTISTKETPFAFASRKARGAARRAVALTGHRRW